MPLELGEVIGHWQEVKATFGAMGGSMIKTKTGNQTHKECQELCFSNCRSMMAIHLIGLMKSWVLLAGVILENVQAFMRQGHGHLG